MHSIKRLAAASALVLAFTGVALAATSPSGVFKGAVQWYNKGAKAKNTFEVQTTFKKGKLTALKGAGNPGVIPYDAGKSTSTYCGAANSYDATNVTITEKTPPQGFAWEFVVAPKQTQNMYGWYTVTLKGNWDSSSKATTEIRFLQHHLPDKGKCDSGFMALTLKKS